MDAAIIHLPSDSPARARDSKRLSLCFIRRTFDRRRRRDGLEIYRVTRIT